VIAGNPLEPNSIEKEQRRASIAGGAHGQAEESGGIGILDFILILLSRKIFMLVGMTLISAAALITALVMEPSYTAMAVLLPSKSNQSSPLGSLMGDLPIGGLLRSMDMFGKEDNNRFLTILDSRTLAISLINRFDLIHHYKFKKKQPIEAVIKTLNRHYSFEEDKLDNIEITVKDRDPQLAADMINFIIDKLDTMSFDLAKQSAKGSRVFFEERMRLMTATLDSVHHKLADFQVKNNMIDLDGQVKATVEALAGIEAEAMSTKIEKDVLASKFGSENTRVSELTKKEGVLKRRIEDYMQEGSGSLIMPLRKTPELAINYAYLYRDVKIQESLYAYILQMYEQAKFREANNSSVVTMMERAVAPEKRSSPKRAAICILAFFFGFVLLSGIVLVQHWYRRNRDAGTQTYFKLQEAFGHFRRSR
jgi:tyrosine-protein kinase Etk/Wzc